MTEIKSAFNASCRNCGLQKVCFPTGLVKSDIDRLDQIVERKAPLKKGQFLFQAGDDFTSLFAIRAGVIKLYSFSDAGDEVIHGFYLPGDVLGVDALASKQHNMSAIAMDSVSVCALPFDQLTDLSLQIPSLNQQIMMVMSKEVNEGRSHSEMLIKRNADQRVAQFIWSMVERYRMRGYVYDEFRLSILQFVSDARFMISLDSVSR